MMQTALASLPLTDTLQQRRQRLGQLFPGTAILWAGQPPARNFAANAYPFRASSHYLYFAGLPIPGAAIHLDRGRLTLFVDEDTPATALWHGPAPTREQWATAMGAEAAYPLAALADHAAGAATVAVADRTTAMAQQQILERPLASRADQALAVAIVQLRLCHDAGAIAAMREAAAVSVQAHRAGMAATLGATTEAEIRAAMEQVILGHDMACAYNSIVTVQGEVLHNHQYHHRIQPGDLLLADVGAEAPSGWASDITRTWPVSGQFSSPQRDLYDLVLAAHDACIQQMAPGVEYREIHLLASQVLASGLVDLGILRGHPESLVEQDAHSLFFPHGVGHLLGLDVHDMEDLGDLAGYEAGRHRSDRFGLSYLRLDRPLAPGMAVTIEPGFYQVPGILNDPERRDRYRDCVHWDRLSQFADVRGIRIEDDVLITANGCEVLTAALPTAAAAIESLIQDPPRP